MIILITGASHTGKTVLAQKLLEKYKYPYLSIDHLKMGLIRSGNTQLTPMSDDDDLTAYLWPIVCEMIKTAIENEQNLIVEGCYIPFNWETYFEKNYLENIKYYCLIMSDNYIKKYFDVKNKLHLPKNCFLLQVLYTFHLVSFKNLISHIITQSQFYMYHQLTHNLLYSSEQVLTSVHYLLTHFPSYTIHHPNDFLSYMHISLYRQNIFLYSYHS